MFNDIFLNKEYELFENDVLINKGILINNIFLSKINLTKLYYLKIDNIKYEISKHNLYDSQEFNELYNTNMEMGCIISNEITFRVFAPTRFKIDLYIYQTGHLDDKVTSFNMNKIVSYFEITIPLSFYNKYFTYAVYDINDDIIEVVDPYAKTTGVNGLRAMITNLEETIKIDSSYPKRTFNEAIVYELHTRDLTSDDSWNGINKGKFLGLIEENTTLEKDGIIVKTGFDHIKELGVTDVQLLPIFDFFMVDESRSNDESYHNIKNGIFNWGYMGLNFNTLEGSYSTNAYDGLCRVNEFKQLVQKYNENNIGIIMDVVYNHTAFSEESNFNILVPGYYHRMINNEFSNASACGNETSSQRYMTRRWIVESILFLAKEYHLSGFRFDLMQIHDIDTMNIIQKELKKIDSSIIVYGEPWSGGDSTLEKSYQASKENLYKINVGAFNDELRDAIKGSVFDFNIPGFVQGNTSDKILQQLKYGIVGGTKHKQIDSKYLDNGFWHTSSSKCVNYASAHDNHTIWDKLTLSSNTTILERKEMLKQCNAFILLSQGLAFLHAGEELCRSKPTLENTLEDNSYDSSDYTNKIRWDNKIKYYDVFEFHKELIKFRKENNCFKLETNTINFTSENPNYISFELENYLIILNNFNQSFIYLDKEYKLIMEDNKFVSNKKVNEGIYTLKRNMTYILKK